MSPKFTPEIIDKLQYYVYRLIDPRNGETFYVGKGKGNRVFSHASGEIEDDSHHEKLRRIRSIQNLGLDVSHVIHRHGMDEKTAFELEAALIDAYPGLSNLAGGHGNSEYGVMHVKEIINLYQAEIADFTHRALLLSVGKTASEQSVYEATRFAWKLDPTRAEQAEVILATVNGIIVAAFIAEKWMPATNENFPNEETMDGRYGFIGREASPELCQAYIGKRIPEEYRKKGAANPIKYTWK